LLSDESVDFHYAGRLVKSDGGQMLVVNVRGAPRLWLSVRAIESFLKGDRDWVPVLERVVTA
jgi:hypothetical protein